MGFVDVDVTAWPLVRARIPQAFDIEAIDSFFVGFDAVLARKTKFVTIIDTTALLSFPDARQRQYLGQCMSTRTFAEATYNLGNAVIILSAPARMVLTAVNWIRRPVTAQHMVGTFGEALDWCCGRIGQGGIAVSPAIAALRKQ
jgi:hypothetical protein